MLDKLQSQKQLNIEKQIDFKYKKSECIKNKRFFEYN